jgi:hypothetical protein
VRAERPNGVGSYPGVVYPPLTETIGSVVGKPSGSRSSDGVMDERVRLKRGVYYTQILVYKLAFLLNSHEGTFFIPILSPAEGTNDSKHQGQ